MSMFEQKQDLIIRYRNDRSIELNKEPFSKDNTGGIMGLNILQEVKWVIPKLPNNNFAQDLLQKLLTRELKDKTVVSCRIIPSKNSEKYEDFKDE